MPGQVDAKSLRVLSVDLSYKHGRDLGICFLEQQPGEPMDARFLTPDSLGVKKDNPLDPADCAEAIASYCRNHCIPIVLLDGPQGWKDPSTKLSYRECERCTRAMAKTGIDKDDVKPRNFSQFVEFSINTFHHLVKEGAALVEKEVITIPENRLLAVESFPFSAWKRLEIPHLPGKRRARGEDLGDCLQILQGGFSLSVHGTPTHDELQALVAGVAGIAVLAGEHKHYRAEGLPPKRLNGEILEGFIVNPARMEGVSISQ